MKYLLPTLLIFLLTTDLWSQKTFAEDIAPIIYEKCATCHRAGEIGPMSLSNYEEIQAWGPTIEHVTSNKIMPPWQPDPNFSTFLGENYLTDEEIQTISTWVTDGMPEGNSANEPDFPDFPTGSVLGTPDLVLEMSEDWLHEGNYQDDYRYFVFPTNFPDDKVIKAVEFRPGNSKIVHHALLFEDVTGTAAAKDAATPEYGFDGFGSFLDGQSQAILTQKQFPGYVPGQKPIRYPDGLGQILQAGADVVVQIHYAPWPVDETDRSKINIFFMDEIEEELEREVRGHIMVPLQEVIGEQFFIPANTVKSFHGRYTVPVDVSLVNIAPHMHLLGKHWEVWAEKPDGERMNLINVPEWDFNWQGSYSFDRFKVLPAGSVIHAVASYDNTVNNPNNPSNPPQWTTWGEGTGDEMYYLPIGFVFYQAGDEDIVFSETSVNTSNLVPTKNLIYPIQPNPVLDHTLAGFHLEKGQSVSVSIFDMKGQKVRTLRANEFFNMGDHFVDFSTRQLSSGIYILQVQGSDFILTEKFVKN